MVRVRLLVVASVFASATVHAATKLEVLGLHPGDEFVLAEKVLANQGFKRAPGLNNCGQSYEQRMQDWVKKGRMDVYLGDIECYQAFEKGTSRVVLNSLMSPHGYVVNRIEYTSKSTETIAELDRRLAEKFGPPSSRLLERGEWTTSASTGVPTSLKNFGMDYAPSLTLGALPVMSETFLGEIKKDLRSRAPKTKTAL